MSRPERIMRDQEQGSGGLGGQHPAETPAEAERPRDRNAVSVELARATDEKLAAVEKQDFFAAAQARDKERELQKELHRLGGPPPGCYRMRIDYPDGGWVVTEGPSPSELLEGLGLAVNVEDELRLVFASIDGLRKAIATGNTASKRERRRRTSEERSDEDHSPTPPSHTGEKQ